MIDINELRRLAQEATPGPWVSQGRYIGTPRHMSYIGEVRDQCGNWSDTEKSRADAVFISAANPAAISELLDRIEAAEKEVESLRQGIAFRDDVVAALAVERDALRAKIEAMERQEPVGTLHDDGYFVWRKPAPYESNFGGWKTVLYALPGAQPAPSVPECPIRAGGETC